MEIRVDDLLRELAEKGGSDLHLKAGRPPMMRVSGDLLPTDHPILSADEVRKLVFGIMDPRRVSRFDDDLEADFSYEVPGLARFRVNAFHQLGKVSAVMRRIPIMILSLDELGHPKVLKEVCDRPQGLVLVTGPTGSGKSTTLAAMIAEINRKSPCHIITIEDPVEFVHIDDKSTINQREVGQDVKDFEAALKRALRQDPDVILVGEMRDRITIETAIRAAETGHLVFSTLHTNDSKQTIDRILDYFPGDEKIQVRAMLALSLEAVVSQRLVRRADGRGRVAAMEIMVASPQIRQLMHEGKIGEIEKAMAQSGSYYGMQTFNQSLANLVKDGVISSEEALAVSTNPGDLGLLLRGIGGSGSGTKQGQQRDTDKAPEAEVKKPSKKFTF
ncbi:MAG: type IV pilus twitching motility protein PilT [Planctomycetota bacterium]